MISQLIWGLPKFLYVYNIWKNEDTRYLASTFDICSLGRPVMEIAQGFDTLKRFVLLFGDGIFTFVDYPNLHIMGQLHF